MAKIVIDSAGDLITNKELNIVSVPLLVYTDKDQFLDDGSIDINNMLDTLENYNGRSYSSCPGIDAWIQAFDGEEEIYVITITSGLSGSYNSALNAKEMYLEDHPNAKVEVFDSLSTGPEMKMAADKILELKKQNLPFEQVCEIVHKYLDDVKLFFVLASIRNLAQNGRVNKLIASAIGVLGISIIGIASETGTIKSIGKARGEKKIIAHLLNDLEDIGYKGGKISICNVQNEKLPSLFAEAVKQKYPNAEIEVHPAGGLCSFYGERYGVIIGVETN